MSDRPAPGPLRDPAAFLAQQLPLQRQTVARHVLEGGAVVWLKRAGPRRSRTGYRALALAARVLRLPVLTPVPTPGGRAAIATEVRRLHELQARGVRVPQVLAAAEDGFLMADLGAPGQDTPSLAKELNHALPAGGGAVLALWTQGLATLADVHARGACLSQAFARNLVRCPDGRIACIDFEDDPAAVLPPALCQWRDALCYAHSTALHLAQAGVLPEARAAWQRWQAQPPYGPELQALARQTAARLAWLRHLPADRRWGRDAQRVRAAWELLSSL
ncbi:hypothetical protein SAMN05428957_11413 [Oryzisolibacter propanilivorax]|uniref:tRNA A-37 threonylcarbamoyl transferase component Bud32 n=1 Tax=Oryzisolibacter propanilivorax TaxID=1527607 RepID=A0A1G9VPW8_9BURK|nr:hypothetical protein [Oryzisolibacter propanilivorax]SDM74001.1 hypothetical protein SAMN05428957_11413 [Oryzisolibacter propanilivorax]